VSFPWQIRAGPTAFRWLRERGWNWSDFEVVVGASGGPRWLVLSAFDRFLAPLLATQAQPVHLLGSSSGAYRFSAYIQDHPVAALRALEEAYIEADWSPARPLRLIRQTAAGILQTYLASQPLRHPSYRLHIVTTLCRGWLAREHRLPQGLALLAACLLAAWGRPRLRYLVQRVLFSDPRDRLPSSLQDVFTHQVALHEYNHREAVLASGAIPLLIPGERFVQGAPKGCLRDGGLIDYHFEHFHLTCQGLVLYPHFASSLMPGWLERFGPRRPIPTGVVDRMVLLSPSPDFVARLPGGRVPDRGDAAHLGQRERRRLWSQAARQGEELVDKWCSQEALSSLRPFQS